MMNSRQVADLSIGTRCSYEFPTGIADLQRMKRYVTLPLRRPHTGRFILGATSPRKSWTRGSWSTSACRHGSSSAPEHDRPTPTARQEELMVVLHPRCCGLDVHKETV